MQSHTSACTHAHTHTYTTESTGEWMAVSSEKCIPTTTAFAQLSLNCIQTISRHYIGLNQCPIKDHFTDTCTSFTSVQKMYLKRQEEHHEDSQGLHSHDEFSECQLGTYLRAELQDRALNPANNHVWSKTYSTRTHTDTRTHTNTHKHTQTHTHTHTLTGLVH